MSYRIYRIPPDSVQYRVCGARFPLDAGEYYWWPVPDDTGLVKLRPIDAAPGEVVRGAARTGFLFFLVAASELAPYAVELVERHSEEVKS